MIIGKTNGRKTKMMKPTRTSTGRIYQKPPGFEPCDHRNKGHRRGSVTIGITKCREVDDRRPTTRGDKERWGDAPRIHGNMIVVNGRVVTVIEEQPAKQKIRLKEPYTSYAWRIAPAFLSSQFC